MYANHLTRGLVIVDSHVMNIFLLSKWIWKLETGDGIWQEEIRRKYCNRKLLVSIEHKPGQSHFIHGLITYKKVVYRYYRKQVGNGRNTRFLENIWIGNVPFCRKFPRLFGVATSMEVTVAHVFLSNWEG